MIRCRLGVNEVISFTQIIMHLFGFICVTVLTVEMTMLIRCKSDMLVAMWVHRSRP